MAYDAVIIGAGMSGLAAGIRLAYYEKSVCILERHTTIGGLNSFYRLRGRNHDVGLHAVTNYAPPGAKAGPLSKVLRQLRLRWDDFGLSPQRFSTVVFPGCTLRFTNCIDELTQQVRDHFPLEADGFSRLVEHVSKFEVSSFATSQLSARSVLHDFLHDALLIEMLMCPLLFYGSASANDMDFTQYAIMFRSIFLEGFARPFEGVRRILKVLVRKFKELGGELRLRSGVRAIESRRGRATSLVLDNGETVEAHDIISSAGTLETLKLFDGGDDQRPSLEPGNITYTESIYSLDRLPSELGHDATIVFYNDSPTFRYEMPSEPIDLHSGIICSPNNFQYDRPPEEGCIRITALANPNHWLNLPPEDYDREKAHWGQRLLESAVRVMPDFRPAIVDTDFFTPRTIRKFTGHINGCVYGSAEKVSTGRTHLENLYLCGNDQGLLGIVGTMMSGISVVNAYLLR
ncbi:MAG TPA: NAD(P)-binding protein [Planctomycetaceae bacterium]|nr:NAD(P)-binding protein [Planctomycetaceae bacterium]